MGREGRSFKAKGFKQKDDPPKKSSVLDGLGKWHCHRVLFWDWHQQIWLQQLHIPSHAACIHLASVALDKIVLIQNDLEARTWQVRIWKDFKFWKWTSNTDYHVRFLHFYLHTKIKKSFGAQGGDPIQHMFHLNACANKTAKFTRTSVSAGKFKDMFWGHVISKCLSKSQAWRASLLTS